MSTITASLLAGASLGLSIAAPIGPTSMVCIQRTLSGGLPSGLATGLGVATVHVTYGALVASWGTEIASVWSNAALLSLVSGAILLAFSIRILRSVLVMSDNQERRRNLAGTYCSAVGLALMNPITPALFMAAMPTFLIHKAAPFPGLVTGVFLGSFGWWVLLNTAVSLLRGCANLRSLNILNRIAGLVIAVWAIRLMTRGLDEELNAIITHRIGKLS